MTSQSEQILEQNLISQLVSNGYDKVILKDEKDLLRNLKSQLEKHNNKTFSDSDFSQILNHLTKTNNVFEKAKVLRDKFSFFSQWQKRGHVCRVYQYGALVPKPIPGHQPSAAKCIMALRSRRLRRARQ